MENINFTLTELQEAQAQQAQAHGNLQLDIDFFDLYDIEELKLYYTTNYNIKSLLQILHYYGLHKNKMVKEEIIQVLLFFETDPNNKLTVEKRMRLWRNIKELKSDPYFSKYILFCN